MEWWYFIDILLSLVALVLLEIILGVDNLVFLTILTEKLPVGQRKKARRWGLTFAWMTRLLLLASAFWLVHLTKPIIYLGSIDLSFRDLFLFLGGLFLIGKATNEIHFEMLTTEEEELEVKAVSFNMVVIQVGIMDIIFSLDSVLTAVGLTNKFWIMALAITIAILVMLYATDTVSKFIEKYPTLKMLALSFLILIGVVLIADALAFHIPRGYIYFAMAFSIIVEALNLTRINLIRTRKKRKIKKHKN